ncbi:MAG: NfeD family protein [Candidatus Ancaeobacter aquaticus]|nr:NfeD family protein [Candidatus Ancaeobacter aquaticus]
MKKYSLFILSFLMILALCQTSQSDDTKTLYEIPIKGTIDLGLAGFVDRSIHEAKKANCETIILKIDTLGGRVDAAIKIRDSIIDSQLKTIAFINKRAISAGALIALATKTIIIAPGGTIGAAKPIKMGFSQSPGTVDEKVVSFLRTEFKSTAEMNGHPPRIAEAFVDQDIVIEGLSDKGKLLTLTANESVTWKLARFKSSSVSDILKRLEMKNYTHITMKANWAENLVRMLTHPILSSILLTLGIMGIIVEIKSPGFGIPGIFGIACILCFFFAHYLVGMANWIDIILFAIGLTLIILEIFIIPGFGIAGIGGFTLIITGIFLALIKRPIPNLPIPHDHIWQAVTIIGSSLFFGIFLSIIIFRYILPKTVFGHGIILTNSENSISGYRSSEPPLPLSCGDIGKAHTTLRPTGKGLFNDKNYEVITDGDHVDKGSPIKIIEISGNKIIVKKV